jgi:hypothetical protein
MARRWVTVIAVIVVLLGYHVFQWWSMCNDCSPAELLNPFGLL